MGAPLIPTAKMPTFEEQQKTKEDNKKFHEEQQKATPQQTQEMKKEAGNLFGKNFDPDYKKNLPQEEFDFNSKEQTPFEKQMGDGESKLYKENSKYNPIIDRLYNSGQISENARNGLLGQNLNNKPDFSLIEGITDKEKTIITQSFTKIEQKNPKENFSLFSRDINTIKEGINIKGFDFKTGKNGKFESEVLNKIGENYTEFKDQKGKKNIKTDFSTAILETKAEILTDIKMLDKNSATYEQSIKDINSGDINKQLEGIDTLYHLAYSQEGEKSEGFKKSLSRFKNRKKDKLIEEGQKIEQQLKNSNTKTIEKAKLETRKQEISQELIELGWKKKENGESGDIFKKVGKVELNSSNAEVGVEKK